MKYFEKACLENGGAHFIVTSSVNAIFASPAGSAYSVSKAAISKAFESLSLTYSQILRFSSIYAGPVETDGLKGRLHFVWKAEKMARYMVQFSGRKKSRGYPSFFYYITCHLLRLLPNRLVTALLKKIS